MLKLFEVYAGIIVFHAGLYTKNWDTDFTSLLSLIEAEDYVTMAQINR